MSKYTKPSLNQKLLNTIGKFIEDYPEKGYKSLAQFANDAIRRRAEELNVFELTPRFTHFNCKGEFITIHDKKLDAYVNLSPKEKGELLCNYCGTNDCVHVKVLVEEHPEILRELEKKGWKYRGR